jgi:hypothetical protein
MVMAGTKAYGVRVRRPGSHPTDDEVSVSYDFPRSRSGDRHPLRIRSSDQVRGGLPASYGAVRDIVRRRRQNGGARKGRVLYVLQEQEPLAVLAYHVPDRGPLEIIAVGASRKLPPEVAVRFQAHLIACLEEAASLLGRAESLAWAPSTDNAARVAETVFEFRRARKPANCRARHYLVRPISR